ncbi:MULTISPECIES: MrcB family domain-containing protein [Rhodobacterales]|uniref:MrcB family domain-containing protein n=1 Tax=Rhodobacterales TaxID=204455 RepID=UPI004058E232
MLAEYLSHVALQYQHESTKRFSGSSFAAFVRHDIAVEARKHLTFLPFEVRVKASVGQSDWASVPWLAFFDPLVTNTATKGFYVVFLINPRNQTISLSMNQGTTEVYNEFGRRRGKEVLKRRAQDIIDRVPEFSKNFSEAPISLSSTQDLPLGYEAGHAFGRTYEARTVSKEKIRSDLNNMLSAYMTLVERGGTTPGDIMQSDSGTPDIVETRKYVLSRRIERSPEVRKNVLKAKFPKCEACGIEPKKDYRYKGAIQNIPLDVHHIRPLSGLAEGEKKRYRIPEDFLILCPNCHRMIHKLDDASDLEGLKSIISFKIAREIEY